MAVKKFKSSKITLLFVVCCNNTDCMFCTQQPHVIRITNFIYCLRNNREKNFFFFSSAVPVCCRDFSNVIFLKKGDRRTHIPKIIEKKEEMAGKRDDFTFWKKIQIPGIFQDDTIRDHWKHNLKEKKILSVKSYPDGKVWIFKTFFC